MINSCVDDFESKIIMRKNFHMFHPLGSDRCLFRLQHVASFWLLGSTKAAMWRLMDSALNYERPIYKCITWLGLQSYKSRSFLLFIELPFHADAIRVFTRCFHIKIHITRATTRPLHKTYQMYKKKEDILTYPIHYFSSIAHFVRRPTVQYIPEKTAVL